MTSIPFNVSADMLMELALGLEPPGDIAARYQFTPTDFERIQSTTWFKRALAQKKQELEDNGYTFRAKMALLAEDQILDTYRAIRASDSLTLKLELSKYLTKLADLEPKQALTAAQGGGFMININLGNSSAETKLQKAVIDIDPDLPPIPDHGVASFPVNTDLIGYAL